jgi:hypothetical protein
MGKYSIQVANILDAKEGKLPWIMWVSLVQSDEEL